MKTMIAVLLLTVGALAQDVNSPLPYTRGSWILLYRAGILQKSRSFSGKSAAIDWVERTKPAYRAIELRHDGVVYPCKTTIVHESAGYGKIEDAKLVGCYSKAEEEEFQRESPPPPGGGWSVN
jgi:hypothetical protein